MDTSTPELLFQDTHYVAVHKPAGLLVHRSRLSQDSDFLLQRVRDRIGRRVYPIHRLDRATSGVILFGLDPGAAERLHRALEQGQVEKNYRCVVRGWLHGGGRIDHPLDDPESGKARRPACTLYRPLANAEIGIPVDRYASGRYSLLEVQPLSGRRHQIRRHLKHIAHPIVGDTSYGKGSHNRLFRERFACSRLLLRAESLGFVHPYTGARISIKAAEEADWARVMRGLDWRPVTAAAQAPAACGFGSQDPA